MSQLQTYSCRAAHIKWFFFFFSLYGIHSAGKKTNLFEGYFYLTKVKLK